MIPIKWFFKKVFTHVKNPCLCQTIKHCPLNFTMVKAYPCAMHAWFHRKVHQCQWRFLLRKSCHNMMLGSRLLVNSCCYTNQMPSLNSSHCNRTYFLGLQQNINICCSLQIAWLCITMHSVVLTLMKFKGESMTSCFVTCFTKIEFMLNSTSHELDLLPIILIWSSPYKEKINFWKGSFK